MAAFLLPNGKQQYEGYSGVPPVWGPLVGGTLTTYDTGTTNPRTTWQDTSQVATNTNPIILDGRGEATVFWSGSYRVVLKDALGNTVWTVDGVADQAGIFITNLANTASGSQGAALVGFSPSLTYTAGSVGAYLNNFYRRTTAEIAAGVTPTFYYYQPGDIRRYGAIGDSGTTNNSPAIQAACNQCMAGGAAVKIPGATGFYRCNTAIDLTAGGVDIYGDGEQPSLYFYGVNGFVLGGGHGPYTFEGFGIFGRDVSGAANPKTFTGILSQGTNGNIVTYVFAKDMYVPGWLRGIDFQFTWNSTIDNCTVLDSITTVRLLGQSCTNSIINSRLFADNDCVLAEASGGLRGEGLYIGNSTLADGDYAVRTDSTGFLALEVSNCVLDQISNIGIDATNSQEMIISGNWISVVNTGIFLHDPGASSVQGTSIANNSILVAAAGGVGITVEADNPGVSITGGFIYLGSAAGGPRCLANYVLASGTSITGVHLVNTGASMSVYDAGGYLQMSNCTGAVSREIATTTYQTIASAASITIPPGDVFLVTGTVNITGITSSTSAFVPFRRVTLIFSGALTFTDGANLVLAGNFVTTADDTITLACANGTWYECSRSIN